MAENSISYGMGLSDQMINQMLQSDDASIVAQAQNYINQSQTQQEEKPSLLKRIGNFFISPAASAEVDINSNQNTLDENQLNYLLQSSYLPSDKDFQIGQFGPNQNYLGKGMRGLESLGVGPNLNYLGDGPMTGSIGIGPNQNYLGKGMQIGSMGQPRYDSGTQTIFPSNMSPALSDLGGITPSYGVANEEDVEQVDSLTGEKKGLANIFDFLQQFSPMQMIGKGIGAFFNPKESARYTPAPMGVYGYTPAQLNQMNALGGYYSEPMRAYRRNTNRISNMLKRGAAGKSFSQKNLDRLLNQAGLGGVDTRGMMDSIKASSQTGYGGYGSRKAASEAAARGGGRDYSSSPGAMAGDMEYGEE